MGQISAESGGIAAVADPVGYYQAGVVVGTHALRGDLKLRCDDGALISADSEVLLIGTNGAREQAVVSRVQAYKRLYRFHLRGYDHISKVEHLVGARLYIPAASLPSTTDGGLHWHQVCGLQVVDSRLGVVGTVTQQLTTAAHPIYVVEGDFGEVMIPAVDAIIDAVDLDAGQMLVNLPEGLVDINR